MMSGWLHALAIVLVGLCVHNLAPTFGHRSLPLAKLVPWAGPGSEDLDERLYDGAEHDVHHGEDSAPQWTATEDPHEQAAHKGSDSSAHFNVLDEVRASHAIPSHLGQKPSPAIKSSIHLSQDFSMLEGSFSTGKVCCCRPSESITAACPAGYHKDIIFTETEGDAYGQTTYKCCKSFSNSGLMTKTTCNKDSQGEIVGRPGEDCPARLCCCESYEQEKLLDFSFSTIGFHYLAPSEHLLCKLEETCTGQSKESTECITENTEKLTEGIAEQIENTLSQCHKDNWYGKFKLGNQVYTSERGESQESDDLKTFCYDRFLRDKDALVRHLASINYQPPANPIADDIIKVRIWSAVFMARAGEETQSSDYIMEGSWSSSSKCNVKEFTYTDLSTMPGLLNAYIYHGLFKCSESSRLQDLSGEDNGLGYIRDSFDWLHLEPYAEIITKCSPHIMAADEFKVLQLFKNQDGRNDEVRKSTFNPEHDWGEDGVKKQEEGNWHWNFVKIDIPKHCGDGIIPRKQVKSVKWSKLRPNSGEDETKGRKWRIGWFEVRPGRSGSVPSAPINTPDSSSDLTSLYDIFPQLMASAKASVLQQVELGLVSSHEAYIDICVVWRPLFKTLPPRCLVNSAWSHPG
eukprot:gnl/MRDRNA2_/MRDRNA2_28591_c0_seq1.p1 gnl/MRDRNA2_/MRDRNA2_28591_c0~~gnl/MRDRNA2_/MRDRNA2_28591_c0_seq1.p1  ORF type:complete len:630 (+),score=79.81 gnl/MRDRNA2_/MRDRNA2_28591_c0_seq1:107-1996(+)